MNQFRLAVWLSLLAAAGCYSDAPAQSTLPEPQYVSGPPGGAFDPGNSYAAYGDGPRAGTSVSRGPGVTSVANDPSDPGDLEGPDTSDTEDADQQPVPAPSESAAIGSSPVPSQEALGPAGPAPDQSDQIGQLGDDGVPPDAASDPTAGVTDAEIDATLSGYGQWVETDDYGQVWRPDATVVGVDFTPYESGGSWAYTDAGWAFACDYPWGWLPFHYGRWAWLHDYWAWVPGYRWAPAWVEWRHGGGVIGWRPLSPTIRDHRHGRGYQYGGGTLVRDHRHHESHDASWRFTTARDFSRPHVRSHLYGNLAEGLRVTSPVTAPPIRARASVHAADLMRNRFSGGGRYPQPGSRGFVGPAQVRDHRGADPARAYQPPAQLTRPPTRYQPYGAAPQTYRPSTSAQPPARTYQPPARAYQPPARIYQPPARAYQPSPRAYQPPPRAYQPSPRAYQPPPRAYQPPPRSYQPPPRSYQPPPRSYQPHAPSSPPSHSWSPPAHASSSSSSGSHASSSGSHSSNSHSSGGGHHR